MKILNIVIIVALVGLTGCAGLFVNSGNTTVLPGSNEIQSPTPTARTNNMSTVKKAPEVKGGKPVDNRGSSGTNTVTKVTNTPTAPPPTPKPTPRVISEETTSKVEVISSRPVVGTDAQMSN